MALGYDTFEDKREFESQKVTRYATTSMSFPCYVIHMTPEHPIKRYTLEMLQHMFLSSVSTAEAGQDLSIHIYIVKDSMTAKVGQIQPEQVKSFLRLFESNEIDGYFTEDTLLTGDLLYALAG